MTKPGRQEQDYHRHRHHVGTRRRRCGRRGHERRDPAPDFGNRTSGINSTASAQAVKPAAAHKRSTLKAHAPEVKVADSAAPVVCQNCGVVESVESFTEKGQASGGGAVAGGVIGGILGHQIGGGRGKDLATVAGAVGGAIAGNEIEKNSNKVTHYRVGRTDG